MHYAWNNDRWFSHVRTLVWTFRYSGNLLSRKCVVHQWISTWRNLLAKLVSAPSCRSSSMKGQLPTEISRTSSRAWGRGVLEERAGGMKTCYRARDNRRSCIAKPSFTYVEDKLKIHLSCGRAFFGFLLGLRSFKRPLWGKLKSPPIIINSSRSSLPPTLWLLRSFLNFLHYKSILYCNTFLFPKSSPIYQFFFLPIVRNLYI